MHQHTFGLAGVMGWPVAHSRSPLIHNYWLQKYGLAGSYVQLGHHSAESTRAYGVPLIDLAVRGLVPSEESRAPPDALLSANDDE